jgi:hypothetical protein
VIVAHHAGEQLLVAALAGGTTTAAGGLVVVARFQLERLLRRLRPDDQPPLSAGDQSGSVPSR